MGSITRVKVNYLDLQELINKNAEMPVMGTFLEGENIYTTSLPESGLLILGNEANGISPSG
jgi:RNA methyltransferase, TrmH family